MIRALLLLSFLLSDSVFAKEIKVDLNIKSNKIHVEIDKKKHKVEFTLPKDMHVENDIQVFQNPDFNLIYLELSDYSAASTLVFAINDQGKKLWELNLGAFNPSPPLVEKKSVYLSAIGKVWKLEKQSGKILWSHKDLYENKKFDFNGAEEIKRKGSWIEFSKNVKVNDESGKIGEEK